MISQEILRHCATKPRILIVSDISNEPDDAESLVRYLLYSNEFDTRGLVACTSNWMKRVVHPEDIEKIVRAYGKVVVNLNAHVHPQNQYRSGEDFLKLIKSGPALYGREALQPGVEISEGTQLLIDSLDESDEPLWVLCWGGTNVLAQALKTVNESRDAAESARFRSKMRVYAISDQDDTGMWIRLTFPDVFYISSVHGWNQYGMAAWTGISGEGYYKFDQGGPDSTKIRKEWIKEHIQIGQLGAAYPDFLFIPEGDTPTFLYLIQNGLGSPEHPDWGSWGGRYDTTDIALCGKHYSDVADRVQGKDGKIHVSNQATVWRWRDAYQNDFAARMQWTLSGDLSKANHAPVVTVNDSSAGPEPLLLEAKAGTEIILDASKSYDPDGDDLSFNWFHYRDPSATQWWVEAEVSEVHFENIDTDVPGRMVKAKLPPPEKCAVDMFTGKAKVKGQLLHLVLEVTDTGKPSMTTYKRVVVQTINPELEGGRAHAVDSIADVNLTS